MKLYNFNVFLDAKDYVGQIKEYEIEKETEKLYILKVNKISRGARITKNELMKPVSGIYKDCVLDMIYYEIWFLENDKKEAINLVKQKIANELDRREKIINQMVINYLIIEE